MTNSVGAYKTKCHNSSCCYLERKNGEVLKFQGNSFSYFE